MLLRTNAGWADGEPGGGVGRASHHHNGLIHHHIRSADHLLNIPYSVKYTNSNKTPISKYNTVTEQNTNMVEGEKKQNPDIQHKHPQ